eukprot:738274-Prorocentrum_minimum.AAC.4
MYVALKDVSRLAPVGPTATIIGERTPGFPERSRQGNPGSFASHHDHPSSSPSHGLAFAPNFEFSGSSELKVEI